MNQTYSTFEEADKALKLTEKFGFKLTPMQITDSETLAAWDRSLNAMEVGCGKTVISTVVSLMRGHDLTVVAVPPILVRGWVRWLQKASSGVVEYAGSPSERAKLNLTTARWVICSHAIFRNDFARLEAAARGRRAEVIVDEAHWLKNPKSVLFKQTQLFVAGDRSLQLLTGTPISKVLDPYSYIKLKTPKVYRSLAHFEGVHVAKRDFWKTPIEFQHLDVMQKNLSVQMISRTKEEMHGYNLVPHFPDSTYDLSPAHYKLYTKLVDDQLLAFDDGSVIDASSVQRLRHALQQLVVNYDYFSNDPENRSAAYDMLDLSLEETECATIGKSKLIVWTKYQRTTTNVVNYINKAGILAVAAYGLSDSAKAIESFLEDEKVRVGVFQYQSANAGLNPQGVCNEALFLEGDTVSLYMRQAIGRIDRVGQTKVPRIRLACATGTVQVDLFNRLLRNDDTVASIEPSKKSIRAMLLGQSS